MKRTISTPNAPAAIGPYSQAIEANGTLYVSGQIPIVPQTGVIAEGGIEEQTKQALKNIEAILTAAGYTFADVVKTTCLLANISDFSQFNTIYEKYFGTQDAPARATFAVKALPKNALVEIEVIATK